jgi:hypothetical protein
LLALVVVAATSLAAGCGSSSTSGSGSTSESGSQAQTSALNAKLPPRLSGLLSPAGEVSLTDSNGQPITHLQSGRYTLSINVESADGNFRLIGPQIRRRTRPHFTGIVLWGVNFVKGTYRYLNQAAGKHATVHVISVS